MLSVRPPAVSFLRLHYSDWPNARAGFIYAFDISARPLPLSAEKDLSLRRVSGQVGAKGEIIKSRARARFWLGKLTFL